MKEEVSFLIQINSNLEASVQENSYEGSESNSEINPDEMSEDGIGMGSNFKFMNFQ